MNEPSPESTIDGLGRYGPVAAATVAIALITWPIAFNLGAYGVVFYEDIFNFVVAATVGLVIALVAAPYEGRVLWWTRGALLAPVLWLALSVIFFDSTAAAASDGLFGLLGLLAAVVSIPTVLKLLMDLFVPELMTLRDRRLLGAAVGVIALIALAGYLVGANNDVFLICDDFTVAGASSPSNCSPT